MHRVWKSPCFFFFFFFISRNIGLFIFQMVTELNWRKKTFCLELARASSSHRLSRACRRHFQMMPSSNFLYFQPRKFLPCAHSLSARFSLLPNTYYCSAASDFFPSSSLAPFPFFVFAVGELHFTLSQKGPQ